MHFTHRFPPVIGNEVPDLRLPLPVVNSTGGKGGAAVLLLTLDTAQVKKPTWGEVTLKTDHAKQPEVKVQFAATPEKP